MNTNNVIQFQLKSGEVRTVFELNINGVPITCLYDSGAAISTWVADKQLFRDVFPNATELNTPCSLGGFGSKVSQQVPAFKVPKFRLGTVTFLNMVILTDYDRKFSCDLVLGDNLFKYAKVTIDRLNFGNLNHPSTITYQFGKNVYDIKTYQNNGVITKSIILNQKLKHENAQAASINVF